MEFSDYIVFADETGDHGLVSIDREFPVFGLVFCVFEKAAYATTVEPEVRQFKYRHFGHDAVILHERELRKQQAPFEFLRGDPARRQAFFDDLNTLIAGLPMRVYVSVIDKVRLQTRYADPHSPYDIALLFLMEKLCNRLVLDGQRGRHVHVLFESRGRVEDAALELEFRRVTANERRWGWRSVDFGRCQFSPVFVAKAANLAGHQISDLIARPLALNALRPDQPNRAVDMIWPRVADFKVFP